MTDTESSRTARGQALYDAHQEKVRAAFEGRKYRVLREIHLPEDQRFETEFGNKGRHGVILEEINDDGTPGEKKIVGMTILRRAAELYGSVDLPPEQQKRKRRTKAEKAADDAEKARQREEQRALQARLIEEVLAGNVGTATPVASSDEAAAEDSTEENSEEDNNAVSGLFR